MSGSSRSVPLRVLRAALVYCRELGVVLGAYVVRFVSIHAPPVRMERIEYGATIFKRGLRYSLLKSRFLVETMLLKYLMILSQMRQSLSALQ